MRNLAILFILSLSCVNGFAQKPASYNAWWQKANNFYNQKQYDSAAVYFEKIAASKPEEAAVYYNLGNTYYRLNQVGAAVLNYERALRIAPAHQPARDNLALAQSRIGNRIQPSPDIFFVKWWKALTRASSSGTWAVVTLVLFIALIVLLVLKRLGRLNVPAQVTGILSGVWFVCLVISFFAAQRKADSHRAVVMQNDAPLMVDPRQTKSQSLVPEGTTVKWKNEVQGWVEVTLPDGRTGWMQENSLAKI